MGNAAVMFTDTVLSHHYLHYTSLFAGREGWHRPSAHFYTVETGGVDVLGEREYKNESIGRYLQGFSSARAALNCVLSTSAAQDRPHLAFVQTAQSAEESKCV